MLYSNHWQIFLVVLALLGCITANPKGDPRRPGKVSLVCCTAVSKAIIPANTTITAYKRQNDLKPCVEAVIFFTENGKYCSDPKARWILKKTKGLPEIKE